MIEYDKLKKQSILKTMNINILTDISNINWKDRSYIRQVKYKKENFNPVLTTNPFSNKISLGILNLKYFVAKKLQFMKKTSVGETFFKLAKRYK